MIGTCPPTSSARFHPKSTCTLRASSVAGAHAPDHVRQITCARSSTPDHVRQLAPRILPDTAALVTVFERFAKPTESSFRMRSGGLP